MVKIEFERAFKRGSFLLVLCVGCLIAILDVLENNVIKLSGKDFWDYPLGTYNWWFMYNINMYISLFTIVFPLLASIAYSDSYVEDIKSGFIKNILVRYSKTKYLITRFLINFVLGGIVVITPLLINLLLYTIMIPSIEPNAFLGANIVSDRGFLPELYFNHPNLHITFRIFICFLFGGVFASIGLACSIIVQNRYAVVIIPFIMYIFLDIIATSMKLEKFSPIVFIFYDIPYSSTIFIFAVIMLGISFIAFFYGGKRSETI
ncbi:membrane-spanning protein [Bacillus mycoides]